MPFPVTINGKTYNLSDFSPYLYAVNLPNLAQDIADTGVAAQTASTQAQTARTQAQNAVASGRVSYDTLAQLNANLAPGDGAQGEVLADGGNSGTYQKIGASGSGSWVRKSSATVPALDARAATLEAAQPLALPYMGVGVPDLAWGVQDAAGRLGIGIDATGTLVGRVAASLVSQTQLDAATATPIPYLGVGDWIYAITSESGQALLAFDTAGAPGGSLATYFRPSQQVPYLGDGDGTGDVVDGIIDEAGRLIYGLTRDARMVGRAVDLLRAERVLPDPFGLGPVAYTKTYNGRETIYVVGAGGETRVTDGTFDARLPAVVGGGQGVKYASDRDGTYRLWRAPLGAGVHVKALDDTLQHVLYYGQSNATRFAPAGATTGRITQTFPAPYQALMFVGGLYPHFPNGSQVNADSPIPDANLASLASLSTLYNSTSIDLEAAGFGLSELLAAALQKDILLSNHAVPGFGYALLKRGTVPYANLLASVSAGRRNAAGLGMRHAVTDLIFEHGEADSQSASYFQSLTALQAALAADIAAITGQAAAPRIWLTQIANWTSAGAGSYPTSAAALAQLAAHETLPGMRLVMPTYHLRHNAGTAPGDGLHIPAYGIRCKDEKFAQAILSGPTWEPLRPTAIVASGATLTLSFAGRTGSLRFSVYDATSNPNGVADPGNRGFEFTDGAGGSATISGVALSGDATQVVITLSAAPTAGAVLAYAYTGTPGNAGGPTTGPRGCLCDSDPRAPSAVLQQHRTSALGQTAQQAADPLANWCVVFRKPVTLS